ncbi:MAG: penicillin-binding protein 2 [Saprospiraceae bacterium]|nr:penicillin-binding protein 2 [Saprospiraceae bacterium]
MAKDLGNRTIYIQIFFISVLLLLVIKAADLQIIDESAKKTAQATTVYQLPIHPARGSMYDRNGKLMVYNIPIYNLMVTYDLIDPNINISKFCRILGITEEEYQKNLDKNWNSRGISKDGRFSKSIPFVFINRLSVETYARLQESLYEFTGFFVELRYVRGYNYPNAAHVLGYLREVNQKEVATNKAYRPGDFIGATGLELVYDQELRGKKGIRYVLKDNLGREMGAYQEGTLDERAEAGKDIVTTIDLDLQAYCEELMQNKKGAIVAIEPSSGEILAMLSAPTYDPNLLVFNRERGKAYQQLSADPNLPLYNRSVLSEQPPGSTFKLVVGLVALQEKATEVNRTLPCSNGYYLGGAMRMGCHRHPTCTNIAMAVQHSCNAYFAHVFRNIVDMRGYTNPAAGLDVFNEHLVKFGIGVPLGIDFPQENNGNFPTSAYYNSIYKRYNERWYSPYIMSLGIGQGEMKLTPFQLANLAATIANRGHYYTPHFCKALVENSEEKPTYDKFRVQHTTNVERRHFEPIIEGMENVVRAGTGGRGYIPEIPICGKTGTVQNPHGDDHSVFIAFAPKNNPTIAVAVYVEHGGGGGSVAAPTASLIIEKYLNRTIAPTRQYREDAVKALNLIIAP